MGLSLVGHGIVLSPHIQMIIWLAQVETGATEPLQPGGALMLGADQDCYAGCTDSTQAYHGLMDEVQLPLACFILSCMMALRPT